MLTWLFEKPITIIMTGMLFVGICAAFSYTMNNKKLQHAAIAIFILTIIGVVVERFVVTDNEQVRATVYGLADFIRKNDMEGVLSHTSETSPKARSDVKREMPRYTFKSCSVAGFRSVEIDSYSSPPKATVEFVVWFNAKSKRGDLLEGPGRRAVILDFQKEEDGVWRFYNYSHHDPTAVIR